MVNKAEIVIFLAVLTTAMTVHAYLPPVDKKDGVEVRIGTFDQAVDSNPNALQRKLGVVDVDGTKPRAFPVTVSNLTSCAIAEFSQCFNFGWKFHRGPCLAAETISFDDVGWECVDLPHDYQILAPWDRNAPSAQGFKASSEGW